MLNVAILAGGLGTRLGAETELVPKPMVEIGGKPILWHIMKRFSIFGARNFYLALGYKSEVIRNYFLNYKLHKTNFSINLSNGNIKFDEDDNVLEDWNVHLINTGLHTMTGGRVKRLGNIIGSEPFIITYGDGLANIDINKLLEFHRSHGKMVTVTAVRPIARFGELGLDHNTVTSFEEKPQTLDGWINGGFFVVNPDFIELIENDKTVLEKEPLEQVCAMGELMAYKHHGFWHCMDTKRDKDVLESLWFSKNAPWVNF